MSNYLLWQLQAMFFTLLVAGVGVAIALWAESAFAWRPSVKSAHALNASLVGLCVAVVVALPLFSGGGEECVGHAEAPPAVSLSTLKITSTPSTLPEPGALILPLSPSSPLYADSARILAWVLLAATLYRWVKTLRELSMLRRLLRGAVRIKGRGEMRVWVSERIAGPFAFAGLRHAHVLLPTAWLAESHSVSWTCRHEFQHIRQGDVQRAYLWAALRILLPVAPWIDRWERALGTLEEYLCDEAASTSPQGRKRYAHWLIDTSAKYSAAVSGGALGRGILNEERILRRRIRMLAQTKTASKISVRVLGAAALSLAAASVWAAQRLEWRGGMSEDEARAFIEKSAATRAFKIPVTPKILAAVKRMHGQVGHRERYEQARARMQEFRPQIEELRKKYGIPEEILAVGIIESGYRNLPAEKNRVKAAGIWQFIPASARSFGLKVGEGVDERLDVIKETDAAFRYLASSYLEYQDWPLAVLSFNMGRGAVSEGMIKHGTRDAWTLVEKGVENDRDYLPKFAAAVVGM